MKEILPIAYFHSPLTTKFGVPRQSGLVEELCGRIVFQPAYRADEAVRGMEDFDYLWLIWGFHENENVNKNKNKNKNENGNVNGNVNENVNEKPKHLTVRPPRLGGNERIGVFASRSPFRPNGLGLSSVRIAEIGKGWIDVLGADIVDGTPVYDIKPYIAYADSHPEARGGFTDQHTWHKLKVDYAPGVQEQLDAAFTASHRGPSARKVLEDILALDPRPHYHNQPDRIYGMKYDGRDIRFRVADGCLTVVEI